MTHPLGPFFVGDFLAGLFNIVNGLTAQEKSEMVPSSRPITFLIYVFYDVISFGCGAPIFKA